MKIGIMTMQRINNYGSFLQAYGLKKLIESLGYETEFVDYEYENSIIKYNSRKFSKFFKTKNNIRRYFVRKKFNRLFSELQNDYFGDYNLNPKDIDTLVIGSDEVFNCLQEYPVGYSRQLFGKDYENINVISYAASFGQTNYQRLKNYNIDSEVASLLNKFEAISVRDNNSYETVYKLINKKPIINLDPVLIYDYDKEMIDNVKLSNYIIVYAYPYRLTSKEKKAISKFAKKHNKKIVSFGMYQDISDVELIINPFEIFSYFKHADFVITDTFHGSIFSIKTKTNFCTIVRDSNFGNNNKLSDLLDRLKLNDRVIIDIDDLETFYNNKVDYKKTNEIIEKEKSKSIKYLKENL